MQRRLIAAISAFVLAVVGAIMLFNYVSTADARALAGLSPVSVLVATTEIPAGTLGSQLSGFVETRQVPQTAVVPGALTSLDSIKDLAAVTAIVPGEQILPNRFKSPDTAASGAVKVPNDYQQLSLALDATHAAGGALSAGSKVAVYATIAGKTQQILPNVVVVAYSQGLVTLALAPEDVQRVIVSSSVSPVWLVQAAKDTTSTTPMTPSQVME